MISGEGYYIVPKKGEEYLAGAIAKILQDFKPEVVVIDGNVTIRIRRHFPITFSFNGRVIYHG